MEPLRLVVLGDSTAFTDHRGPQLPDEPTLYPNVLARQLEALLDRDVDLSVVARPGNSVREAWRTLSKDRHVQFEVLAGADAVVVGLGSFDHAPAGVPAAVEAVVPYLRPASLRRRVRKGLHAAYPWVVRATRGLRPRTPAAEFDRLYDRILLQVRGLAYGAAGVVLGPTSQRADYYGRCDRPHRDGERRQRTIAERHGFPFVDCWDRVLPHVDELNVDGIHWPPPVHADIGGALARELTAQLRGHRPRPPRPGTGAEEPA